MNTTLLKTEKPLKNKKSMSKTPLPKSPAEDKLREQMECQGNWPWTWKLAWGVSCTRKCAGFKGMGCNEVALQYTNSKSRLLNAAKKANLKCKDSYGYEPYVFPGMIPGGNCVFTSSQYCNTCDEKGAKFVRLCPFQEKSSCPTCK